MLLLHLLHLLLHGLDFGARFELKQFDVEGQLAATRNCDLARLWVALIFGSVPKLGWDPEAIFATALHNLQTFGKARNHTGDGKAGLRVLVEDGAVFQHALVAN